MGWGGEARAPVEQTIRFAKKLNPSFLDFNMEYRLVGNEYYGIAKEMNLFDDGDLSKGDYARPIVRTLSLSTNELIALRKRALLSFYFRPAYIFNTLRDIRSMKVFGNYVRSGIRLIRKHAFNFGADTDN